MQRAHRRGVDRVPVVRGRQRSVDGVTLTDRHHVRDDLGTEHGTQELLGDGAEGDPGRGLPGGGPLQHRAGVVEAVLLHAGEVGVTGPGPGQRGVAGQRLQGVGGGVVRRVGSHDLLPLRPLGVADLHRERPAHRHPVPDAAEQRDLVLLELHPGAAAVAEPAAGELGGDVGRGHRHTCRQSFEDGNQGGTMRFTCGEPAQHARHPPTPGSVALPVPINRCRPRLRVTHFDGTDPDHRPIGQPGTSAGPAATLFPPGRVWAAAGDITSGDQCAASQAA